jgi:hypothetical protein
MSVLVFISHSSKDNDIALALANKLRQHELEVWVDHEQIQFGDSIPEKIADGLSRCDVVLVLVSMNFVQSSWCRAEYEPLLKKEIESNRTFVIPLRLDDTDIPTLLSAKRYFDLRKGINDTCVQQLANAILSGRSVTKIQRLKPNRVRSYGCSLLAMIIAKFIHDFPVTEITDNELLQGRSLLQLYKTIDTIVQHYEELCNEILQAIIDYESEVRPYGYVEISSRNRRLLSIATDMRDISQSLDSLLRRNSDIYLKFKELSEVCATISSLDGILYIRLSAPVHLTDDYLDSYFHDEEFSDFPLSREIQDINRILAELNVYKNNLRKTIAKLISK